MSPIKSLPVADQLLLWIKQMPRYLGPSKTVAYSSRRFAVPSASLTIPARRPPKVSKKLLEK